MTSPLLYDFTNQMYYAPEQEAPKDALFAAEKQTILSLAAQGNCVLVGRCADWLLRNDPHCLRVWLHADKEARLHRIMDTYGLDEETAHAQIEQGDRKRATNYQYYTREIWGHAKNFHLAIDTTFGDDYALDMIPAPSTPCKTASSWSRCNLPLFSNPGFPCGIPGSVL